MILIKHLSRWIKSSVSQHFSVPLKAEAHLFVEAQIPRKTQEHKRYFELRMDGPHLYEVSSSCWRGRVEVNILCTAVLDPQKLYDIDVLIGIAQDAVVDIPLFRFGNGPDDDPADQFGCLYLLQSSNDMIEGHQFGRIETNTPLQQATVEGHYRIDLSF